MTLPLPLATAGNGDFGTSPFFGGSQASHNLLVTTLFGVSDAKAQGRIEKLGAELFTCRLGAFPRRALPRASFAKLPCMSANGLVSRVTPVHTAMRSCARDEGIP